MNRSIFSIFEKVTIKKRLFILTILSSLIVLLISTITFSVKLYDSMYIEHKALLENTTKSLHDTLQVYVDKANSGEMSKQEAQKHALDIINKIRFLDGRGYFFVYDFDGKCITVPIKPELAGQDRINSLDKKGFAYIKEITNIAKEKGSGFLTWYFDKPGAPKDQSFPKLGYIMAVKEWNWAYGTGDYIDDIQNKVIAAVIPNVIASLAGFIIVVTLLISTIGKSIIAPIEKITNISLKLAENDLSVELPDDNNNTEIGALNRSFKKFTDNLKNLVQSIYNSVDELSASAEQTSMSAEQTSQGAEQVSQSIQQLAMGTQTQANNVSSTVENINQINMAIQTISENISKALKVSRDTQQNADTGNNKAKTAVEKTKTLKSSTDDISMVINELGELGTQIGVIVDLIKNIASQTNLLALNAAIEAARAGEHGKGFAVVAEEVKKLAGQSSEATDKITDMIKEIQNKTQNAVHTMEKNSKEVDENMIIIDNIQLSLKEIEAASVFTSQNIENISKEIEKLSVNSDKVVKDMESVSAITEETAASSEEISSITQEQTASLEEISASTQVLTKIAENLQTQVAKFKI